MIEFSWRWHCIVEEKNFFYLSFNAIKYEGGEENQSSKYLNPLLKTLNELYLSDSRKGSLTQKKKKTHCPNEINPHQP